MNDYQNDIRALYADFSACLLAITNALSAKGVLTKVELSESAQERLLAMQPSGAPDEISPHPFYLLRQLAIALPSSPRE